MLDNLNYINRFRNLVLELTKHYLIKEKNQDVIILLELLNQKAYFQYEGSIYTIHLKMIKTKFNNTMLEIDCYNNGKEISILDWFCMYNLYRTECEIDRVTKKTQDGIKKTVNTFNKNINTEENVYKLRKSYNFKV